MCVRRRPRKQTQLNERRHTNTNTQQRINLISQTHTPTCFVRSFDLVFFLSFFSFFHTNVATRTLRILVNLQLAQKMRHNASEREREKKKTLTQAQLGVAMSPQRKTKKQ